jgi:hypothetical protein
MRKAFLLIALLLAMLFSGCDSSTAPVEPFYNFITEGVTVSLYPIRAVVDGTYKYEMVKENTVISSGTVLIDGTSYTFTSVKGKRFTATVTNDKMTFSSDVPLDDGTTLYVTTSELPVSSGDDTNKTPTTGSDGTVTDEGNNQTPPPSQPADNEPYNGPVDRYGNPRPWDPNAVDENGFSVWLNKDYIYFKAVGPTKYPYAIKYPGVNKLLAFSMDGIKFGTGASIGWVQYPTTTGAQLGFTQPVNIWPNAHVPPTIVVKEDETVTLTPPPPVEGVYTEYTMATWPFQLNDDDSVTVHFKYVNTPGWKPTDTHSTLGIFPNEVLGIMAGTLPDPNGLMSTVVEWETTYERVK